MTAARPSLWVRALGPDFQRLPASIQRLHTPGNGLEANGRADIEGADNPLGRLVAALMRLPKPGRAVPLTLIIQPTPTGERWTRQFGTTTLTSHLTPGADPGQITERIGPIAIAFTLETDPDGIRAMRPIRWWLGRLPLPRRAIPPPSSANAPKSTAASASTSP